MIVVDASAVTDLLLFGEAEPALQTLLEDYAPAAAPHLIDLEVLNALRRVERSGRAEESRIGQAVAVLPDLPIARFPHGTLAARIWQLRTHVSPYDAAYIALAEQLDAELITTDRRLARAQGHHARITVFPG